MLTRPVAALLGWLLVAGASPSLTAKGLTTAIRITGAHLTTPKAITDPDVLKDFLVWAGPGTWMNDVEGTDGFIVDWASGPLTAPPSDRDALDVSFYVKYANRPAATQADQLAYRVLYVPGPGGPGYVYLPGKGDPSYRLNVTAIYRGVEGHWFRATPAWHHAVSRLLAP
jgi:hypothetical protein